MYKVQLIITALIGWCIVLGMANDKIVNCDFETVVTKFKLSNIDPTLCTHVKYPMEFVWAPFEDFIVFNELHDFDHPSERGYISRTMDLKDVNEKLQVFVGVYFRKMEHEIYLEMAVNATKRNLFKEAVLSFIKEYKFDGLDLNWSNFQQNGSNLEDKIKFVIILKELKEAFENLKLKLSITVDAATDANLISFDIPSVAKYVNFINVKAFRLAAGEVEKLIHNAPLKSQDERNVMSIIDFWIKQGVERSKLVLALPFFGAFIQLSTPQQIEAGSSKIFKKMFSPYGSFCNIEKTWNYKWESDYDIPVLHMGNQMFSYDNAKSIGMKVDFGNCLNLAGFMISNIDFDDLKGECGEKYPLLKAVNNKLRKLPELTYCLEKGFIPDTVNATDEC